LNDLGNVAQLAYLLKHDSVSGNLDLPVEVKDSTLIVGGREIRCVAVSGDLRGLPWGELGVDIVMESTGRFTNKESCMGHLEAGAKKVIIGAPAKGVDKTFVMGVNEVDYDPKEHHIVSNASCTTNCLAPVAKVLHDNFGMERGLMTTIHSYTMDQRLLDSLHKDLRRARAATLSMIPTTTGAAVAVTEVIPELKGKLNGMSVRVPTPNVSLVDLVADLAKDVSVDEVNRVLKKASEGPMKGILYYNTEPIVSIDMLGSSYSSIVDAPLTYVIEKRMVKVLAWYDNEYGYSSRMVDLALYMGRQL
jgi:glyceraldehyde 3-phosphate dehydrogenase